MNEELKKVDDPVGMFVFAHEDIDGTHTANGTYFHYSDVCKLLNRYKKFIAEQHAP